jgi:hypothetical protein
LVEWPVLIYLHETTFDYIRKQYSSCALEARFIQYLEELPTQLHLRLGRGENFWREELENTMSKL